MPYGAAVAEPVFELKFGQVGIANLKLRQCDPQALRDEIERRVAAALQLFGRAPLVLDPGYLPLLRRELPELILKYVNVNPEGVDVHVERDGEHEVLELSVALPERSAAQTVPGAA